MSVCPYLTYADFCFFSPSMLFSSLGGALGGVACAAGSITIEGVVCVCVCVCFGGDDDETLLSSPLVPTPGTLSSSGVVLTGVMASSPKEGESLPPSDPDPDPAGFTGLTTTSKVEAFFSVEEETRFSSRR
jgi:hypothetical protein